MLESRTMDVDAWVSKSFTLRCVDHSDLGIVAVCCDLDINLPIVFVLLNPSLVKRVVIYNHLLFSKDVILYCIPYQGIFLFHGRQDH